MSKSFVWADFEKLSKTSVQCALCKVTLKFDGSTSSMVKHLKLVHKKGSDNVGKGQSTLEAAGITRGQNRSCNQVRTDTINQLVGDYIAEADVPLHTCEYASFRAMFQYIEPNYKVPVY